MATDYRTFKCWFFFLAPLDRDLWLLPTPDPTPVLEYLIVIPGVGMDIF